MQKRGLGKGLQALIPTGSEVEPAGFEWVDIDSIRPNPNQPRRSFGGEAFAELVASVREHGIVQPVLVRPCGDDYELVAGERRWRAAREAGLGRVPAVVRDSGERESVEMSLVENVQRENLNAMEEAAAYRQLVDEFGMTQEALGERIGKSRSAIANTLRLLQLPRESQELIADGRLSSGHGRALLLLEDEARRKPLSRKIVAEALSVRTAEDLARRWNEESAKQGELAREATRPARPGMAHRAEERALAEALGVQVRIRLSGEKGRIELRFGSREELIGLLAKLQRALLERAAPAPGPTH